MLAPLPLQEDKVRLKRRGPPEDDAVSILTCTDGASTVSLTQIWPGVVSAPGGRKTLVVEVNPNPGAGTA
eukprot:3669579-Amphidinium_carterae.1